MSIEFYDVKTRKKVKIPKDKVQVVEFKQKNGQVRYAYTAKTDDGRKLTRFCKKSDYDAFKK
nr:hypothetical protein [Anaerolineae bacterium]